MSNPDKSFPNRNSVATGHPAVTEAAAAILRSGGNAFDAVVAAGFCAAVAEPGLTSLGGGGFLTAMPAGEPPVVFDFFSATPGLADSATGGGGRSRDSVVSRESAALMGAPASSHSAAEPDSSRPHFEEVVIRFPGTEQHFNVGLGSAAVPGNLRGYVHVHSRLGRLPLAEVVAPAVALASGGVQVTSEQAYVFDLVRPILTLLPEGRALYGDGEHYVRAGDVLCYPELADFLESIPLGGVREFYEGVIGSRIVSDMRSRDGLMTARDLREYRVVERRPLRVRYRDTELLTNPRPSFGGTLLAHSLNLLEGSDVRSIERDGGRYVALLAACMREVDSVRGQLLASTISPDTDLGAAPGSASEVAYRELLEAGRLRLRQSSGGTTHAAVCDADGNVASMTTSNGEGSGYIVPGCGVMLNNMMGEDDLHPDGFHCAPAGSRVASMMSPSVLLRDGRPLAALGSGGSKRIRTALLQVISALVDYGLTPEAAVSAPRLHWDGEHLQAEPGIVGLADGAGQAGVVVNEWGAQNVYFGGVQVAMTDGRGAGDPRRGGAVDEDVAEDVAGSVPADTAADGGEDPPGRG